MAANPAVVTGVKGVPKAETALKFGKRTARVYTPRIVHLDWKTQVHVLIGVASHAAWCILAMKYKTLRLRGYDKFKEHKRLTGDLMKAWCWELAEDLIKKSMAELGVAV